MTGSATEPPPYRGRFAPTPSGPLHLGSLLTALASYLQARSQGGRWLLRIDDLDTARCRRGADTEILRQLEAHGLYWDETPRYQAAQRDAYAQALERLAACSYPCTCTRAELAQSARAGPDGPVYPGTCREGARNDRPHALRLRVGNGTLCFEDSWQGRQCRRLADEVGDFVVQRADGIAGYQLACAVDEEAQGITEVVRGMDLLGSTFRQLHVLQRLGRRAPAYRHLPVLVDAQGRKLSKQNHAAPIAAAAAGQNIERCLHYLGHAPPGALQGADTGDLVQWALQHWRPDRLPVARTLMVE